MDNNEKMNNGISRSVSNNLEYIKDLFENIHPKYKVYITEDNEIYYKGDLAISLTRGIDSLLIVYDSVSDKYKLLHMNKKSNNKGAFHYHLQLESYELPKIIMSAITLHYDYTYIIKKRKQSVWDLIKK